MSSGLGYNAGPMAKKTSRKKKIVEFVLTIAGTAVVAVTFYVHEVKREEMKSQSDAMAQAKQSALLREDLDKINIKLDERTEAVNSQRILEPRTGIERARRYLREMESDAQHRQWLREIALRELDKAKLLAQSIDDKPRVNEIDELVKKEKQIDNSDFSLFNNIINESQQIVSDESHYKKEFEVTANQIFGDTVMANNNAHRLLNNAHAVLDKRSDETEKSYKQYTRWSYALYSAGLILGLAGKIIGLEDDDDATG